MAAATDAFSDDDRAALRNVEQAVAAAGHGLAHPLALGADHQRDRPLEVDAGRGARRRRRRRPARARPRSRSASIALQQVADLGDAARARSRPADAFTAPGVTDAEPRAGITTPCAPSTSALRTIAPRLCGSVMPSSSTISGGSPASFGGRQQLAQRRVAKPPRDRDDALVHAAAAPARRPSGAGETRPRRAAPSRPARRPRSRAPRVPSAT